MTSDWFASRPDGLINDLPIHWKVTMRANGKQYSFYFSGGSAITEIDLEGVLECLLSDYHCDTSSFEWFCREFGLDADSRKAEKTYKAIVKEKKNLERIFSIKDLESVELN